MSVAGINMLIVGFVSAVSVNKTPQINPPIISFFLSDTGKATKNITMVTKANPNLLYINECVDTTRVMLSATSRGCLVKIMVAIVTNNKKKLVFDILFQ